MADNQQTQSASPDSSAQSTQQSTAPQTLAEVYKEFNVEETASSFAPQRQVQQAPAAPQQHAAPAAREAASIPDPVLDPNGHRAWLAANVADAQTLRQSLSAVTGKLTALEQQAARRVEEADIRAAVHSVKQAGFEADDDFIEIALGQKARQDGRFLAVYNNRQQNPAAWGKALSAFANEAKGKYQFKADPTLAENVRAAKQSTQTAQSTKQTQGENSMDRFLADAKTPTEFSQRWEQVVRGNSF